MKKFVVLVVCLTFIGLSIIVSGCGGGRDKSGRIIAKNSADKKIIQTVQKGYFEYNKNISFKEAIGTNSYLTNVTWNVLPAVKKGAHVVILEGDVSLNVIIGDGVQDGYITPAGESNWLSWIIYLDSANPYDPELSSGDLKGLIRQYRREYYPDHDTAIIMDALRLPDGGPYKGFYEEPYFKLDKAHFHAEIFTEPSSDEIELTVFKFVFEFSTPHIEGDKETYTIAYDVFSEYGSEIAFLYLYGTKNIALTNAAIGWIQQMVYTPNYAYDPSIY
jgi:hypothetical protein